MEASYRLLSKSHVELDGSNCFNALRSDLSAILLSNGEMANRHKGGS